MRQAIHAPELAIERLVQGIVFSGARSLEIEWQQGWLRTAGLDDLVIAAFKLLQRPAEQAHRRTLPCKRQRHGLANAIASARDNDDSTLMGTWCRVVGSQ